MVATCHLLAWARIASKHLYIFLLHLNLRTQSTEKKRRNNYKGCITTRRHSEREVEKAKEPERPGDPQPKTATAARPSGRMNRPKRQGDANRGPCRPPLPFPEGESGSCGSEAQATSGDGEAPQKRTSWQILMAPVRHNPVAEVRTIFAASGLHFPESPSGIRATAPSRAEVALTTGAFGLHFPEFLAG